MDLLDRVHNLQLDGGTALSLPRGHSRSYRIFFFVTQHMRQVAQWFCSGCPSLRLVVHIKRQDNVDAVTGGTGQELSRHFSYTIAIFSIVSLKCFCGLVILRQPSLVMEYKHRQCGEEGSWIHKTWRNISSTSTPFASLVSSRYGKIATAAKLLDLESQRRMVYCGSAASFSRTKPPWSKGFEYRWRWTVTVRGIKGIHHGAGIRPQRLRMSAICSLLSPRSHFSMLGRGCLMQQGCPLVETTMQSVPYRMDVKWRRLQAGNAVSMIETGKSRRSGSWKRLGWSRELTNSKSQTTSTNPLAL